MVHTLVKVFFGKKKVMEEEWDLTKVILLIVDMVR